MEVWFWSTVCKRAKNKSNYPTRAIAALISATRYAILTRELFTFAGVNRTCGSFLSPEALGPFSAKILIQLAPFPCIITAPALGGHVTLKRKSPWKFLADPATANMSRLIIGVNQRSRGQAKEKKEHPTRGTIIQYVGAGVLYSLLPDFSRKLTAYYVDTYIHIYAQATWQAGQVWQKQVFPRTVFSVSCNPYPRGFHT